MANEGFLGKFSFGGERAATNDHPGVLLHLPLDKSASAAIPVGTLMKGIDVLGPRRSRGVQFRRHLGKGECGHPERQGLRCNRNLCVLA